MQDKRACSIISDIALAIKKLELFSDDLAKKNFTPLQKTIRLAKNFIAKAFLENQKKPMKSDIQDAIWTIQKNFLFIQKLKNGSPSEQILAEASIKAIERYNEIIQKSPIDETSISQRISRFIDKKLKNREKKLIHLPFEATVEFTYCQNPKATGKINQKALSSIQETEIILQEEVDVFRMKAISLLKLQGLMPMGEEVRKTPITAALQSDGLKKILSQVLKPFPGEVIVFKGEFERTEEAFLKSIPLFGSFEILTHSKQTGFPHPIQHTGWALADCMIPLCPLKPELLKNFLPLFKLKQQIALELLPKGRLITKAKNILKLKKQVFEENKIFFLEQHQKLRENMFGKNIKSEIEPFFNYLKTIPSCYSVLAETQESINFHFISRPFEKLTESFFRGKNENLDAEEENMRYLEAKNILEEEQKIALNEFKSQSSATAHFISVIGALTAKRANAILLQHLSQSIGFFPRELNREEQKMQTALYKQLYAFQKELSSPCTNENILSHFMQEMSSDIELFVS